jgi:hypothetical protein
LSVAAKQSAGLPTRYVAPPTQYVAQARILTAAALRYLAMGLPNLPGTNDPNCLGSIREKSVDWCSANRWELWLKDGPLGPAE